jgi:hypothetical protein
MRGEKKSRPYRQATVYALPFPSAPHGSLCNVARPITSGNTGGVAMCLDFRQRIVMVCAAAFALTALARPAAAQPKLASSSLGHWRGYWISTMDPRMQGPVEQFIDTERTRRVLAR